MEMEEIVKILIFVLILVILVGGFILYEGKMGGVIDSIRNMMRLGG